MIRSKGLTHIQLTVRDLERSLAFYTRAFGLKERFREGGHMVFLNTPGTEDLITLNEYPRDAQRAGDNGGINHFGFRLVQLSEMDAAVREVEAAGGTLISRGEHAPGVPFAYVRDPDGYVLELSA
jgi:catechol 2,3-dioxygenase-like lactoylglutathione lyase family enzyme